MDRKMNSEKRGRESSSIPHFCYPDLILGQPPLDIHLENVDFSAYLGRGASADSKSRLFGRRAHGFKWFGGA